MKMQEIKRRVQKFVKPAKWLSALKERVRKQGEIEVSPEDLEWIIELWRGRSL